MTAIGSVRGLAPDSQSAGPVPTLAA